MTIAGGPRLGACWGSGFWGGFFPGALCSTVEEAEEEDAFGACEGGMTCDAEACTGAGCSAGESRTASPASLNTRRAAHA
jgi:hypothetical protein